MQVNRKIRILYILFTGILFHQCDIKKSDIANEQSFVHVYNDFDFNNEYYPLDIAETDDGFLILSTKMLNSDSTNFDWNYHYPFVIKTDTRGEVEWTYTGDNPYVSPIADILAIDGHYYFFAQHNTGLSPTLFEIDLASQSFSTVSSGNYGSNSYALKAIADKEKNILLLVSEKQGTKDSRVYKISGSSFDVTWSSAFTNSANDGTSIIIPAVLEQLSHHGRQYPYFIKEVTGSNGNIEYYLAGCYNNTQLSLNKISYNGNSNSNVISGSRNSVIIATCQQVNDSVLAIAKNDNSEISLQVDFPFGQDTKTGIEDINGTVMFREVDGNSLILSDIVTFHDKKYMIYAAATKGKQVALFIYNTNDYTIKNIHYLGSTNDIKPVSVKQTTDDAILVLCKTLVTNKYPRIALYKVPIKNIGLE